MNAIVQEMWDEWGASAADDRSAAEAECAGILTGLLPPLCADDEDCPVELGTGRIRAVRRLLKLWRHTCWSADVNIADSLSIPREKKGRVRFSIERAFAEELNEYASTLASQAMSMRSWAWLRGLWGSCGGLYLPQAGYYLVVRVAAQTSRMTRNIMAGTRLPWKERIFRGALEMLLRDQENIVTFLCNIGLSVASLNLEERAAVRSVKDNANRAKNCDTANIDRTLRAADEQIRLASRIVKEGLLDKLPANLRELVEARLAVPEASLAELGESLSPPVTKSTVKYRWDKLKQIADAKKN